MTENKIIEYVPKEARERSEYVPKVKKYKPAVKSIRIIGEPEDVIEFESVDDFNKYYSEHLEEFDKPSVKLNKKYKIPGYTLTKVEKETCLKKVTKNKTTEILDLQNKYKSMAEAFNQLSEEVQAVVKHLTGASQLTAYPRQEFPY